MTTRWQHWNKIGLHLVHFLINESFSLLHNQLSLIALNTLYKLMVLKSLL